MWDANFARCQALYQDDPLTWWEGMTGDDHAFGTWLQTQRYNREIGRLRKDRAARLKTVKFVWDTIEAACEMAKGCPMVKDGSGSVEVAQVHEM